MTGPEYEPSDEELDERFVIEGDPEAALKRLLVPVNADQGEETDDGDDS